MSLLQRAINNLVMFFKTLQLEMRPLVRVNLVKWFLLVRVWGFQFVQNSSTTQDLGLVGHHLEFVDNGGVFHRDSVTVQTPNSE